MGNRSGVIIVEDGKVAMIERIKGTRTYYVFPGGQQEEGETLQQAAIREAYEELGVVVKIRHLFCTVPFNGLQYFYEAQIISGEFGTGKGPEFTIPLVGNGSYSAVWLTLDELQNRDVIPKEVVSKIVNNF